MPVEESMWLVEQRPRRSLELGGRVWRRKTDPGAVRLAGGSDKIPSMGLVVWMGKVESVMKWQKVQTEC